MGPSETILKACAACPRLSEHRTQVVPWLRPSTDIGVSIMVIGEAPGDKEDRAGTPFVGPSRKGFDALLGVLEVGRDQVYITNAVKCFAPSWKPTTEDGWREIQRCRESWLIPEIQAVKPQVVLTLGVTALRALHNDKGLNPDPLTTGYWPKPFQVPGDSMVSSLCHYYHPSPANPRFPRTLDRLEQDPLLIKYREMINRLRDEARAIPKGLA